MQARFIDGHRGRIFCAYFAPEGPAAGAVLCVPPFCEEMNRSRALMALQGRQLAQLGYACLLFDWYGTGDSEGCLQDADWDTWEQDTRAACDWLQQTSGQAPILWGIRLGALMAAQLHTRDPERFPRLMLWHPVSDGRTYMTQVLRLRVATLVDRQQPPEKVNEMRLLLQAGESLEVSGYVIPGPLACGIDTISFKQMDLSKARVDWFEPVASESDAIPGGAARATDALKQQGCDLSVHPVAAPAVWNLSEREDASAFARALCACLDGD